MSDKDERIKFALSLLVILAVLGLIAYSFYTELINTGHPEPWGG